MQVDDFEAKKAAKTPFVCPKVNFSAINIVRDK